MMAYLKAGPTLTLTRSITLILTLTLTLSLTLTLTLGAWAQGKRGGRWASIEYHASGIHCLFIAGPGKARNR